MAKKTIDGKMHYTFVGLLNRMDSRNMGFSKDIPEEIEFKGHTFRLDADKKTYLLVNPNDTGDGSDISDWAAIEYGSDLLKYLTEFDFIVNPREKVKVTCSEYMLIRYVNMFAKEDATEVSIETGGLGGGFRALYFWTDRNREGCLSVIQSLEVNNQSFCNFKPGVKYKLQDIEVSYV